MLNSECAPLLFNKLGYRCAACFMIEHKNVDGSLFRKLWGKQHNADRCSERVPPGGTDLLRPEALW